MECNKYKKRAIFGIMCFFYVFISLPFFKDNSVGLGILNMLIFGILSLFLMQPYINCLFEYNEKHKPPYSDL